MDLSVIILNYNAKDYLRKTIEAANRSITDFALELIVVDNSSTDGSFEMVQREFLGQSKLPLKLIKAENKGFSYGNNRGIELSTGRYILLLNPDCEVDSNTLHEMIKFMDANPTVGMSTCKLLKENGELDWACRRNFPDPVNSFFKLVGLSNLFPNSKLFSSYNRTFTSIDEESEIQSCCGAFQLVSRVCLNKIGLMDEEYFMYGEDIDWCYRAHQAGFKIWYYPKVKALHHKGSTSKKASRKSLYEFHRAMKLYYQKHLAKKYWTVLNLLVYGAIWLRYLIYSIRNHFLKNPYVSK